MNKNKISRAAVIVIAMLILISSAVFAESDIVAKVNGTDITAEQFVESARYARFEIIQEYDYMYQVYSMYGIPIDDAFNQQYINELSEENKAQLGQRALNQLTYNLVLDSEAQKANVTVSDDEVTASMKEMFGFGEDQTAAADTSATLGAESVEVGGVEPEINKELEFQQTVDEFFSTRIDGAFTQDFFRKQIYYMLLENKLLEETVFKDQVFEDEMVSARHILVETEDKAQEILDKLAAGEDWNTLAAENSIDTSNKDTSGDLGWFSRGTMVLPFEEAAFALEPGEISGIVKSDFGYHIIASDGKEVRPLEGEAIDNAKYALYQAWFDKVNAEADIETFDGWLDLVPNEPEFTPYPVQPTSVPEAEAAEPIVEATTAP